MKHKYRSRSTSPVKSNVDLDDLRRRLSPPKSFKQKLEDIKQAELVAQEIQKAKEIAIAAPLVDTSIASSVQPINIEPVGTEPNQVKNENL